jgi:glycosyltransferase involved in cell wall biosynthesis
MRVLLAADRDGNPFVDQLGESLEALPEIEEVFYGAGGFWEEPRRADLLHLHWPEALVGWRDPEEKELRRVRERLALWREGALVVATVHNTLPHYGATAAARRLFRTVYEGAEGIVHMGRASREDFASRYPDLEDKPRALIPHGLYGSFPDEITREEARAGLALGAGDFVALSFGTLRHPEELSLLHGGFRTVPAESHRLLVAGTVLPHPRRAVRLYQRWQRRRLRRDPRVSFHPGFVPEERVQVFLRAADLLVIPRLRVLNSGNLVLGFSFGLPVLGPDTGVVGEILRETGNPVFEPGSRRSFALALREARELRGTDLGERNRRHAERHWAWPGLAERHLRFYESLRRSRKARAKG